MTYYTLSNLQFSITNRYKIHNYIKSMQMEAVCSSETFASTWTRRCNSEDRDGHVYHRQKLKPSIRNFLSCVQLTVPSIVKVVQYKSVRGQDAEEKKRVLNFCRGKCWEVVTSKTKNWKG